MVNGIYGYYDTQKNQMVYIGQSKDIYSRHASHINLLRYNEQVINRVLQNNPDRYKLVIIKVRLSFSKEDRDILEKHYIEFYNTFIDDNKFNFTPGGDFSPSMVPEIAKKISKARLGKNYGLVGEKHPFYGKHHSGETIKKISKANSGENNPFYGKHHSEKTKRKMILSKNTTGYLRVSLDTYPNAKSGKRYVYRYYNNGKRKSITSVSLEKLKKKVLKKGLKWEKINKKNL